MTAVAHRIVRLAARLQEEPGPDQQIGEDRLRIESKHGRHRMTEDAAQRMVSEMQMHTRPVLVHSLEAHLLAKPQRRTRLGARCEHLVLFRANNSLLKMHRYTRD